MSNAFRSARFVFQAAVVAAASLVNVFSVRAADAPADMPSVFPGDALAYAEAIELGAKLDVLRGSELFTHWLASPQYQRFQKSPEYRKLQAVLEIAERQLGGDVWTMSKQLLGGNLALAAYPKKGSKQPDVLAVLRTRDPAALAELRQQLNPIITLAADNLRVTQTLAGVELMTFPNDAAVLARKDSWLLVATNRKLLDHAVAGLSKRRSDNSSDGLERQPSYLAMVEATDWEQPQNGQQRVLRAWVDTPSLIAAAGGKPLPEKLDNALGSLLFGDVVELLRGTPFVCAAVDVRANSLSVRTSLARDEGTLAERYQAFAPPAGGGVFPPPAVPDAIGGVALYRDFTRWYANREQFLQEQVLPGFDKFEAGLANLLPGRDFSEDVLPLLGQQITFVTAPQDFSHLNGEPGVKLPGMALVIELAKPDEAAPLFQLLFQTLAAVLNIEAGQQGRQPWVVTSESYHDVQVSYAKYLEKPAGQNLGMVYNFLPASARVGDRFILSSSLPLCKQLIDSLRQTGSGGSAAPPKATMVRLQFDSLAKMLASDTEFFVGRMTQEGRSIEQARAELNAILDLLRRFESLELATEVLPRTFQIRLDGTWK